MMLFLIMFYDFLQSTESKVASLFSFLFIDCASSFFSLISPDVCQFYQTIQRTNLGALLFFSTVKFPFAEFRSDILPLGFLGVFLAILFPIFNQSDTQPTNFQLFYLSKAIKSLSTDREIWLHSTSFDVQYVHFQPVKSMF